MAKFLEKMVSSNPSGSSHVLQASKQPPYAGGSLGWSLCRGQTPHASGFVTHALIFSFPWGNS